MIQTVEQSSAQRELERFHPGVEIQPVLSELVIPAVRGEFYDYRATFSEERPLCFLMKCKSNKARFLEDARRYPEEANLVFLFDNPNQSRVCTIRMAQASGLLYNDVDGVSFGNIRIAPTDISVEDFNRIRTHRDISTLVEICQVACLKHEGTVNLKQGAILAITTDGGKYGLIRVTTLAPSIVQVTACHILL